MLLCNCFTGSSLQLTPHTPSLHTPTASYTDMKENSTAELTINVQPGAPSCNIILPSVSNVKAVPVGTVCTGKKVGATRICTRLKALMKMIVSLGGGMHEAASLAWAAAESPCSSDDRLETSTQQQQLEHHFWQTRRMQRLLPPTHPASLALSNAQDAVHSSTCMHHQPMPYLTGPPSPPIPYLSPSPRACAPLASSPRVPPS